MKSKPSHSPSVSIIIVTYNGRRYLRTCLESLEDQLHDGCQIIVVDNASSDGGPELIEEGFPQVTLLRNPTNRGFAAACNQGATAASGQVLVFLNQDTQVAPGWLDALVNGLFEAGDIGLTTSKVLLMSQPDRIHLCGQDVHYTGLVFGRGFNLPVEMFGSPEDVGAVSGASFAISKSLWQSLGGFDENFYMYYEETDLSWRAQLLGYRCRYIPASVVYHDYRGSRSGFSRPYHSFRNRYLVTAKNWHWLTLLLLLPALFLAELIEWALAFDAGWQGIRAKLHANFWLLAHLKRIQRLRSITQASRRIKDEATLANRTQILRPARQDINIFVRSSLALCNMAFKINCRLAQIFMQVLAVEKFSPSHDIKSYEPGTKN